MKQYRNKRIWLVAGIAAALMLLGCAAAVLRLQDLKLGEYPRETGAAQVTEKARDVITLQGYTGSSNYLANQEWFTYSRAYEASGEEALSTEELIPYLAYGISYRDQVEKIEEICAAYGLTLLGHEWMEEDVQTTFQAVGIDGILREDHGGEVKLDPGYYYSNGTFQVSGRARLKGKEIPFTFRCSMKESLDTVHLALLSDIQSYAQWDYTLPEGTEVLLALSKVQGLLLADFDTFFVSVNATETAMTTGEFETFADLFDLTFRPQKVDQEAARKRYEDLKKTLEAQRREWEAEYAARTATYDARVRYLLENATQPQELGYVFLDLDGNGVEELLTGRDGSFGALYTSDGETIYAPMPNDGTSRYYLCGDNVVASISNSEDNPHRIWWFVKLDGTNVSCLDCLTYHDLEKAWSRVVAYNDDGTVCETYDPLNYSVELTEEAITEEEAQRIIDSYSIVSLETRPLAEYPLE